MNELYIVVLLIILAAIVYAYWVYSRDTRIIKIKKGLVMEFKTSLELSGLPIITFYQGDKAYNFLLDTGSNVSYVNVKSDIKVTPIGVKDTFMGANGIDIECEKVNLVIYRADHKFNCNVHAADLDTAFSELKKEYGVLVTGILGCDFMDTYNYCMDFKEYTVYIRK